MGSINSIDFFCFWEVGKIGINVTDDKGNFLAKDITLDKAKVLLLQLQLSIDRYEELERYAEKEESAL